MCGLSVGAANLQYFTVYPPGPGKPLPGVYAHSLPHFLPRAFSRTGFLWATSPPHIASVLLVAYRSWGAFLSSSGLTHRAHFAIPRHRFPSLNRFAHWSTPCSTWWSGHEKGNLPSTPGQIRTSLPQGQQVETWVVIRPLSQPAPIGHQSHRNWP